jgi:hypothetical protein
MARCGTCGTEGSRIRICYTENGLPLKHPKDECPACAPQSFEKLVAPSDRRLWAGYEADPAHYKRTDDGYQASDSVLQDLLEWANAEEPEEVERQQSFLEQRRAYCATRRTPETPEQKRENDEKARSYIRQMEAEQNLLAAGFILPE